MQYLPFSYQEKKGNHAQIRRTVFNFFQFFTCTTLPIVRANSHFHGGNLKKKTEAKWKIRLLNVVPGVA